MNKLTYFTFVNINFGATSLLCNVPLEAWTTNGISALASRVGKHMVMDVVTATTCKNEVGKVRKNVKVMYDWKPNMCPD
nr:zinc knuckle CX2CX4HX4C [Tanacetum cinerariifolium]